MIGFLRKDLYSLMSMYKKNLMLVFVLYSVMGLSMKMDFLFYMLIFMMGFYSLSSLTLDQSSGWDRYARTLPVSTRQAVGGKYLVTLVFMLAGVIYTLLVTGISFLWRASGSYLEYVVTLGAITGVVLLMMGIMLPACYKWGVEKARNGYLVVFALVFAVPMLFKDKLGDLESQLAFLNDLPLGTIVAIPIAIGLTVYAAGYFISCAVYEKQEF